MEQESSDSSRAATTRGVLASVPTDVSALLLAVVVCDVCILVVPGGSPLRTAAAFLLLFLFPGYALLAMLFPDDESAASHRSRWPAGSSGHHSLEPSVRLALSFGLSVALIPVLGLLLSLAPLNADAPVLVGCLTATVLPGAWYRARTTTVTRYHSPVDRIRRGLQQSVFDLRDTRSRLVTVGVVLLLLVSTVTISGALVAPPRDETYTSLSLLTENESGALVADDYPRTLSADPAPLSVRIANHEGQRETYTLVTTLQRVRIGSESAAVTETRRLDRRRVSVAENASRMVRQDLTSELRGDDLRVVVRLYRGQVPDDLTPGTAYRRAFVWVNGTTDRTASTGEPNTTDPGHHRERGVDT